MGIRRCPKEGNWEVHWSRLVKRKMRMRIIGFERFEFKGFFPYIKVVTFRGKRVGKALVFPT